MNTSVIHLLQEKYPHKTLTAIDIRSAIICESQTGKDIAFGETVIRARQPRTPYTVDLEELDQELALFLCIEDDVLYYMPTSYHRYCRYNTNVSATGSVMDDVAQMIHFGLEQSAQTHGDMQLGETRMFCLRNDPHTGAHNPFVAAHVTVQRECQRFQIAAEVRTGNGPRYQVMLSLQLPADDLQQCIAEKADNIAYYLN